MINEETIKSLYNDKPTLLEWLKRVEAQLEELKKVTNFDTLTANNVKVKEDMAVGGILRGNEVDFQSASIQGTAYAARGLLGSASVFNDFSVKGKPVSKAIYLHKLYMKHIPNATMPTMVCHYLSINPVAYTSMADIFAHKNDTTFKRCELFEYLDCSAVVIFTNLGAVTKVIVVDVSDNNVIPTAATASDITFVKDEVVGLWNA